MADWADSDPGPYHSLIDAERAAAEHEGEAVTRIALIRRLREATGLGPREAKDAVESYLVHRDDADGVTKRWVDDFLDAERAAARRDGRPLSRLLLIRALREASGLDLRSAGGAVKSYLKRRGATLPLSTGGTGYGIPVAIGTLVAIVLGLAYLLIAA